jgi:hypothetical protein
MKKKTSTRPRAKKGLSVKQQAFCRAYVRNNGNGVQAAREAGYRGTDATLRTVASENLTKPNVKAFLKQIAEDAQKSQGGSNFSIMCINEALQRTSVLARASLDDILDEHGRFDLAKARRTAGIYAIKRATFHRSGKIKSVELRDKNGALELMGKHHDLWTGDYEDPDEVLSRFLNIPKRMLPSALENAPGVLIDSAGEPSSNREGCSSTSSPESSSGPPQVVLNTGAVGQHEPKEQNQLSGGGVVPEPDTPKEKSTNRPLGGLRSGPIA